MEKDGTYPLIRERVENTYSHVALLCGFVSGALLLIVCIGLYVSLKMPDDNAYQLFVGLAGLWWLVLGAISVESFELRPGPKRPSEHNFFVHSWSSIFEIVRDIRDYPQALLFLLLYFFYSDGISTVSSVGILFAQRDLCMRPSEAVIIAIIIPLSAAVGNYIFLQLQRLTQIPSKIMLLINLYFFALLAAWGCIGLLTDKFGLHKKWEIYLFGVFYGLNLGSSSSYSRTLFTDFIPPGREARFFSLYGITDRGSSWIGPLMVAVIVQSTGAIRLAMLYLLFALLVPSVLVQIFVNHEEGRRQSGRH